MSTDKTLWPAVSMILRAGKWLLPAVFARLRAGNKAVPAVQNFNTAGKVIRQEGKDFSPAGLNSSLPDAKDFSPDSLILRAGKKVFTGRTTPALRL